MLDLKEAGIETQLVVANMVHELERMVLRFKVQ